MRHFFAWIISLGMLIPVTAAAGNEALVLGFRMDSQRQPHLVSLTTSPRVPAAPPVVGAAWTIAATADRSALLWSRQLPIPHRFHAGEDSETSFVAVVPSPSPGTHLSLLDETQRELWAMDVDQASLDGAAAASLKLEPSLVAAKAATHELLNHQTEPALQRQIDAARATGAELSKDLRLPYADSHSSLNPGITARSPASSPLISAPDTAAAKMAAIVVAHVVDESGGAPGVAFPATVRALDGSEQQDLQVEADGSLRMSLTAGTSYRLSLAPPPPLATTTIRFNYSGAEPDPFVVKRGWQLEMILKNARTGEVISDNLGASYSVRNDQNEDFFVTASRGRLLATVSRDSTAKLALGITNLSGYAPSILYPLGLVSGNGAIDILLDHVETVFAHVSTEPGAQFAGSFYAECNSHATENEPQYWIRGTTIEPNSIRFYAPSGRKYYCDLSSLNFSRRFTEVQFNTARPVNWTMPTTIDTRFDLIDTAGRPYEGSFYGESNDEGLDTRSYCVENPCMLPLPSQRPATVQFFLTSDIPFATIGPEVFRNGDRRKVAVRMQRRVNGRIVNPQSDSYARPRVRAYEVPGDRFVVSTRTNGIGEYELPLMEGTYVFEIDTNREDGGRGNVFYRRPHRTSPITILSDQQLPDIVLDAQEGEVQLSITQACFTTAPLHSYLLASAQLVAADGTHVTRPFFPVTPPTPTADGRCVEEYRLSLSPGHYNLSITRLGWPQRAPVDIEVVANQVARYAQTFPAEPPPLLWSTRFSDARGKPLRDVQLLLHDPAQAEAFPLTLSEEGRIAIPYAEGWGVEIQSPDGGSSAGRTFLFGRDPLPAEVVLEDLPLQETMENGLLRLYGNGDRAHRFNILVLADGYADEKESFTDSNRNGTWDGLIWYDLDGDHVYSSGDLTYYDWNHPPPVLGTVPTDGDEPFVDLNGDGYLSVDDKGLFLEASRSFVRSLLGSDFWNEHQDAFNVYVLFTPSPQAGFNVVAANGAKVWERRTRYGATFELARSTLELDRNAALVDATAILPEVDLAVVAVNTPLWGPRSNVTLAHPGLMVLAAGASQISPNDFTSSHEMGHFVGALCDEYEEFGGVHPAAGSAASYCPNVSFTPEASKTPWLAWLPAGFNAPSRDIDGSVGMFEGASYYAGGAYRPSYDSRMRSEKPFFNAPSRAALLKAVQQRMGLPTSERRRLPPILPRRPN